MENKSKGRIMHVEDRADIRDFVQLSLEREGYEVLLSLGTVAQALSAIPEQVTALGIDIGILDGKLPDGYGGEVAKAIKDHNLPIQLFGFSGGTVPYVDVNVSKTDRVIGLVQAINNYGESK